MFQHTKGVTNAVSGYAGGDKKDAELRARQLRRAPATPRRCRSPTIRASISYGKILQIYFSVAHDPTQLNRQGPDTGPQYRSAIFPQTDEQAKIAKAYIAQLDAAKVVPASRS